MTSNSQQPVIGIIGGKGRMGALFAEFFVERGLTVLISDIGTKLNNRQLAEQSDILIISVPIDRTEQLIREVLPYIKPASAIMDFTSIKTPAIKAMLRGNCEVLGLHPMFGNSNPIPGQTVIFCPTKKSGHWSAWLESFLHQNRVKIQKMSPEQHDKTMNIAQGLIHFAEITFADGLRRCNMPIQELLQYTGKSSELKIQLAARILDQDPGLYGNIQIENPYALKSLKAYKQSVDELLKIVQQKKLKNFEKYFEKNRKFLGSYTKEAYHDSTYLIDKFLELKKIKSTKPGPSQQPGKNHLAILGPKNTFSDLAADKYLSRIGSSSTLKKYFAHDIEEIFELVEQGKVAEGLLPIENKLHGSVRESLDGLFYKKVHIAAEINIPIHHCLFILTTAKKSDIRTIMSHSQALNQCKKLLRKNFPKTNRQEAPSTGAAIEKLLSTCDKSMAVIAPEEAAENEPGLKILAKNIEDENDNCTTFVLINRGELTANTSAGTHTHSRLGTAIPFLLTTTGAPVHTPAQPNRAHSSAPGTTSHDHLSKTTNHPKTSIAFHFSKDAPGSLFTVFQDFAGAQINLTKIESRPTKAQLGDYIFYLDFEGHISDPHVRKTLQTVSQKVARLKILGSY